MDSRLFQLKNYELNGTLAELLEAYREDGLSFRSIAKELSQQGCSVGYTSVTDWCWELGIN